MENVCDVSIKVKSQTGTCIEGHKVGDEWIIKKEANKTPGGICCCAFFTLGADLRVLRFGGSFPWRTDPDTAQAACPDADNPVIFELRCLRED